MMSRNGIPRQTAMTRISTRENLSETGAPRPTENVLYRNKWTKVNTTNSHEQISQLVSQQANALDSPLGYKKKVK